MATAPAPDDDFDFKPAVRKHIGALIGLWAESGGGKTLTALWLARAFAAEPGEDLSDPATLAIVDARICYIDTDGGRAAHYAVADGELPSGDPEEPRFAFVHVDFKPPFTPERLSSIYVKAEARGFKVCITDSFSLIWEGEGGIKDIHDDDAEAAVQRAIKRWEEKGRRGNGPNEDSIRGDAGHWKNAKTRHRKMVTRILQSRMHLIFCGHADDKMRMEQKEESFEKGGRTISYTKTEVTAAAKLDPKDRWVPICEKKFPRQLVVSVVLDPEAPGVPIPKKRLPVQLARLIPLDVPLNLSTGLRLAAWARGATKAQLRPGLIESQFKGVPLSPASRGETADGAREDLTPPPRAPSAPDDVDDFPGDRKPPADQYDDAPPNAVWLGITAYDPKTPCPIPLRPTMAKGDWQQWAKAFLELTERAPNTGTARAWRQENADQLLALKAVSPSAHGAAVAACPPEGDDTRTESPRNSAAG